MEPKTLFHHTIVKNPHLDIDIVGNCSQDSLHNGSLITIYTAFCPQWEHQGRGNNYFSLVRYILEMRQTLKIEILRERNASISDTYSDI